MRLLNFIIVTLALTVSNSSPASTGALHIACAANFRPTLEQLATQFHQSTGQQVLISSGATGLLYAQIVNGARFDLLLAADTWRPQRLVEQGLGHADTLIIYAIGQLGLVSHQPLPQPPSNEALSTALSQSAARLAIANPDTAPYGSAARQTLQRLGVWPQRHDQSGASSVSSSQPAHIVIANNAAQAFGFFSTGNTRYALVGPAQWRHWAERDRQLVWPVPPDLHAPLEHAAVVTLNAPQPALARQFIAFMRSAEAKAIITAASYQLPPAALP